VLDNCRSCPTPRFSHCQRSPANRAKRIRSENTGSARQQGDVSGGGMGIRTPDPDLAKVVLYQLSYAPIRVEPAGAAEVVGLSGLEPETSRLSGVCSNQLSYKPMLRFRSASSQCLAQGLQHRTIRYHLSICQTVPGYGTVGYVMDPSAPSCLRRRWRRRLL
jgi:hypothetical protein